MASSLSRSDSDALIRLCVAGLTCRRPDGGLRFTACLSVCLSDHSSGKTVSYLQDVVGGLQVEQGCCGSVLMLLAEQKETLSKSASQPFQNSPYLAFLSSLVK